jgi:hypothetical protein
MSDKANQERKEYWKDKITKGTVAILFSTTTYRFLHY